ncbi:uncharacterized protein LOC120110520 [Phoenix dactylifera]|uniref:Uncharacterized protein LOC120110520 n=1 Tax=Phoenix dactylifera TaxID=42345 RepID=A0A8B9A4P2_PHODC|nr:uncharacterized protein LOC120110520 [Phoenix dactylifera]
MNEDQMNDELGIDPRQSNGREPTLKAPVDANGKVIVRCTRGMFLDYEVSHKAVAIMRQFFNGPWLSWREVPTHAKVGMWNKFEMMRYTQFFQDNCIMCIKFGTSIVSDG